MISVAVCTYNGEKFIKEQLNSIIHQTQEPDEIIICDDCSRDNTVQIVNDLLEQWDGEFTVSVNESNLGFKDNFVKAIGLCKGDIIFLSDQDDVWDLNKIDMVKEAFAEHPEAVMVFHDATFVDNTLKVLYPSFWNLLQVNPDEFLEGNYNRLIMGNAIQGAACAFRRQLYDMAAPFCKEAYHDEWLALVAVATGEIYPLAKPLLLYRQGDNAIGGMPDTFFQKLNKWTRNICQSLAERYKELNRRSLILNEYDNRFGNIDGLHKKFDFVPYKVFLEKRFLYINAHRINLFQLFRIYYTSDKNPRFDRGKKDFIRDLFTSAIYQVILKK